MRTFVIADVHGHPEIIRDALEDGAFEPGRDRLVFAGDFLDRGRDAQGCLDLIERYANEVLLGNHDLAVLLDTPIWPQGADSPGFRPLLVERVLDRDPGRAWKAVVAAEEVLVSHAGISARYERVFRGSCRGELPLFADMMNTVFRATVRAWVEGGEEDDRIESAAVADEVGLSEDLDLFGDYGPFWFRPAPFTRVRPLAGVTQVAGHTPAVAGLAESGFHMIDPGVWLTDLGEPLIFRYAIIEDGRVRVREGPVPEEATSE